MHQIAVQHGISYKAYALLQHHPMMCILIYMWLAPACTMQGFIKVEPQPWEAGPQGKGACCITCMPVSASCPDPQGSTNATMWRPQWHLGSIAEVHPHWRVDLHMPEVEGCVHPQFRCS